VAPGILRCIYQSTIERLVTLAELGGTPEQQLIFLNLHWGRRYEFASPQAPGEQWTATARFGGHDRLQAPTSAGLLEAVRAHYQANKPPGQ
jgi:hypothetical protein